MELEVFGEAHAHEEPTRLRLVKGGNENVVLMVVDVAGYCRSGGYILKMKKSGKAYLCGNINPDLGFQLDKQGRLVLEND